MNNIGTTTTFNQQQVFNSNTNIYTGDSSNAGASISALNIRALSSSNVGDTSGTMAYGSGGANSNVFINLSLDAANGTQTTAAAIGDTLNAAGNGTAITVNTLSSSGTVVANVISVGGASGYANTAQGMINAINNSGLGVTASFTTAAVAGTVPADDLASELTNTGIMISGAVGVGNAPTSASYGGTATTAGAANADILSGSITLQVGNGSTTTITMAQVATADQIAQGAVTLDDLKSYINSNAGLGVTAGDTTGGKLTLASTAASHPSLNVTSNLVDNSIAAGPAAVNYTATNAYSDGITTGTFASTGITDSTAVQTADAAIG